MTIAPHIPSDRMYRSPPVTAALRRLMLLLALVCTLPPALAEPLSIEDAFRPPQLLSMRLAPDGKRLVALGRKGSATAVLLIDAETLDAKPIYDAYEHPALRATAAYWAGSERLVVQAGFSVLVLDLAGEVKHEFAQTQFVASAVPDAAGHERIVVQRWNRAGHLDRIDVRTGRREVMDLDLPGIPTGTEILDREGAPLVVSTRSKKFWSDDTTVTHWWRPSLEAKWQPLAAFNWLDVAWRPVALLPDGKSLVVASSEGRDTTARFRYDLAERRVAELMAGHPTEDILDAEQEDGETDYVRVVSSGMRPTTYWYDARKAAVQRAVDELLPGRINALRFDASGDRVLVASAGDVDLGRWYLLDLTAKTLRKIASVLPHIEPERMLLKRIVQYRSADGTVVPAYLTLPRDVQGPLPAVMLVHGGPVARDHCNWDPEVQMLASRGYAVLQPQFRGSSGFGRRFEQAGYGQFGRAMQDDVTAGALWLTNQGIADPKRMCIYGSSYGGYAAMWGLIRTPGLFRCGVDVAGVTDLNLFLDGDSDVNDHVSSRLHWRRLLDNTDGKRRGFDEVSPLRHAEKIQAPVLVAHGTRDLREPFEHGEKFAAALKAHGKTYRWLPLEDVGHGFADEKQAQKFYPALFEFLDTHIGEKSRTAGGDAVAANR